MRQLANNKNKPQSETRDPFKVERPRVEAEEKEAEIIKEKEAAEYRQAIKEEIKEEATEKSQPILVAKPTAVPLKPKSQQLIRIEKILEQDLGKIYFSLPENLKKEFKVKGEETAAKIEILLQRAKVKVKEVIKLIMAWLKMIPGVNKYFIEQEAKIKTDKILKLKK